MARIYGYMVGTQLLMPQATRLGIEALMFLLRQDISKFRLREIKRVEVKKDKDDGHAAVQVDSKNRRYETVSTKIPLLLWISIYYIISVYSCFKNSVAFPKFNC